MKEFTIPSTDGMNNLHTIAWEPTGDIKAILQISHGMIEYIERYNEMANYLSNSGILVIGNDHLGHGLTAKDDNELGYMGEGKSQTVVADLHEITKYAKKTYGEDIPFFLFGHSMGSFMARRYIMTYGTEIDGAIICGTGSQPGAVLKAGQFIANLLGKLKGYHYRSEALKNMAFGAYNKRIPDAKSPNAWLSVNEANVEKYDQDKYCTYLFTVNGYLTLFDAIEYIQKPENYNRIPKTLPLLFIAGEEDPVGNYGKGVKQVYMQYKNSGISDIKIHLFPNDRHEITNEDDREEVFKMVKKWIQTHLEQ